MGCGLFAPGHRGCLSFHGRHAYRIDRPRQEAGAGRTEAQEMPPMKFSTFSRARFLSIAAIIAFAAGCSGSVEAPLGPPVDHGVKVSGTLPPAEQAELDKLLAEIDS